MSGYNEIGAGCFADGYLLAGGKRKHLRRLLMEEYHLDEKTADWHIDQAEERQSELLKKFLTPKKYVMREPEVENKYNLTMKEIRKLKVADRSKITEKPFRRNDIIKAWCISEEIGTKEDIRYSSNDEYWIGIYDENAGEHAGEFRCTVSAWGGMCHYNFETFFNPEEIENKNDQMVQERFLKRINWLLDEGILVRE